jgi:hypothetical protein
MIEKPRQPAWWMLYAVVPVMGGLVLVEARSSFSPGWHKAVQVGIILFVYGLVWVWLRANDSAMLHDSANRAPLFREARDDRDAAQRSARRLPGRHLTPSQGLSAALRPSSTLGRVNLRAHRREIRKCSHSLDRRSSRS